MQTLLPDPPPADFAALLARRREWGADTHDEVWQGVCHVAPAAHNRHGDVAAQLLVLLSPLARAAGLSALTEFNIGEPDDFRVPDGGLVRPGAGGVFLPSAALVIEVVSPGDRTWRKLDFYAGHGVEELLIADPDPGKRTIDWLALADGGYQRVAQSGLIALGPASLAQRIDWPD